MSTDEASQEYENVQMPSGCILIMTENWLNFSNRNSFILLLFPMGRHEDLFTKEYLYFTEENMIFFEG